MKNKSILYSISALSIAAVLTFSSCAKKKAFKNEDGQASEDNRDANGENDQAVNDANNAVFGTTKLSGKGVNVADVSAITGTIQGGVVDTAGINNGTIKINYNGTTVNNRTRTGSIQLTIIDYAQGKRWKQAGCVIRVDYLAYKVTRASDGKSFELNGTQYLTNETGGTWWELIITKTQSSLGTSVTGSNLNVTFSDGKTATYNINRRITYTIPGNILTCTAEGIGSSDGLSSLENYGTTRDGDAFTSQVTTPIVWNLTCGPWAPTAGKVTIKVAEKEFELKCTFAVNQSGDPVEVAPNTCAYGWKVEWTHKKKTKNKIFGYK